MTVRTFPHPCPNCGKLLDAASSTTNPKARPKPRDLTLCIYCAAALEYDATLQPVALKESTLNALPLKTRIDIAKAQAAIRFMIAPVDRKSAH